MANRDQLHRLIDSLPDGLIGEVIHFAEFLRQRQATLEFEAIETAHGNLPAEDEPISPDEEAGVESARKDPIRYTSEEVERMLGL